MRRTTLKLLGLGLVLVVAAIGCGETSQKSGAAAQSEQGGAEGIADARAAAAPPIVTQDVSAESYGRWYTGNAVFKRDYTGEQFCWQTSYALGQFLQGYLAWKDTAWLDWAVKSYDLVLGKMQTGPDGYKGFIGPFIYDSKVWCDVHVGDSILMNHMLLFAEVVLKDAKLSEKYGEAARRYVAVAKKHLLEKWDARGTWREDGPYGAYVSWDTYCDPGKLKSWRRRDDIGKSGLSLPFNKQNDMALAALRIWRATGEEKYRDKAERIFAFMRSRMQLFDGHYVWNYWEPFGPWDVEVGNQDTVHWVQVHPERNYQAGEVHQIAEAYHSGLVFGAEDIRRIIRTNLEVMWNGDRAQPKFANSYNPHKQYLAPREKRAGCLWTGLLDFSQSVRDIEQDSWKRKLAAAKGPLSSYDRVRRAYLGNVVLQRPVSLRRRYVQGEVRLPAVPTHECRDLYMAAVIPSIIRRGRKSIIISKAWMPDELAIDLYSADGKKKEAALFKGPVPGGADGHAGIFIYQWDGRLQPESGPAKDFEGDYRVRWTFRGGYREFPVTIVKN